MYHERICASRWTSTDLKLGMIMRFGTWLGGAAFAVVIGLLGWSLKANYDNMEQLQQGRQQIVGAVNQQSHEIKQAVAAQGGGS